MKKGFTIVELIVVLTILAIIASIIGSVFTQNPNPEFQISPIFNPDAANAQANQRLVEEMAEQNGLMRELIQMKGNP